ncbi:MAG: 50S ribosomal protein L23 [Flavobacteriales bacterium]|nr:50S ribosomal protein L23 [Flavobacteriales bacterium]
MGVIIKPIITEKMTAQAEKGYYGFAVDREANKIEIKKEIEQLYGVNVENINTMVYAGKRRRRYTKSGVLEGKTLSYKKAIVKLSEGETIDFYSNI